jgi:RNA polymerase sigma-70 factor, ECF subfamily
MSEKDFDALILPHRESLFRHAMALTHNNDEAEDLVQETVLRALKCFASYRAEGSVRSWLLTILRNMFINNYRNQKRGPRAVFLDALENPDPVLPPYPGPERMVFVQMENEALQRAVAALPLEYRQVLELSDMQGFSYQEISEELHVPIGTVRSRLSRARNRVRRSLYVWRPELQGTSKMAFSS